MNIVSIIGSGRIKSDSAKVAGEIVDKIKKYSKDTKVTTHILYSMDGLGCSGCMFCKSTGDFCYIKDSYANVLKDIQAADVVIVSGPVYFAGVTGNLKNLIDRTFCFLKPDFKSNPEPSRLPAGKIFYNIISQGNPNEMLHADVAEKMEGTFAIHKPKKIHTIRILGMSLEDGKEDRFNAAIKEAKEYVKEDFS